MQAFSGMLSFHAGHAALFQGNGPVLLSLLLAGLAGGAMHCGLMCGPFVLTQTAECLGRLRLGRDGERSRFAAAVLAPYHLGRLTTYAGLGAAAGGLASRISTGADIRWLPAALMAVAALLFLAQGLQRLGIVRLRVSGNGSLHRLLAMLAGPLLTAPAGWRGYALGVVLGFLPCGLLYGAVAAAAATGSALGGGLGMALFALGTVPALVAVGWLGAMAEKRWQPLAARVGPMLMLLNAVLLAVMAWAWVA